MVNLTKIFAGLLIVVAVLLGLFAWMLSRHPAPRPVAAPVAAPTFPVVVAAHGVPAGQALKSDDLQLTHLALNPPGAYADVNTLVGRIPLADIGQGSPIVETNLLAGLAGRLAPGERAVAIKVDELAGVGGRVRPGDTVDLFMLLRRDGTDGEIGRSQARLLLSKVRVLAYGRSTITSAGNAGTEGQNVTNTGSGAAASNNAPSADAGTAPGSTNAANDPANARTAVVAVPVEQVDALALADAAGRLVMALRSPADPEVANENAFPPSGTVLTLAGGQSALQSDPSNRAAAGLLLEQVVRDKGGNRASAPMPLIVQSTMPSGAAVPGPVAVSRATTGGVEVIRGSKRETVGW